MNLRALSSSSPLDPSPAPVPSSLSTLSRRHWARLALGTTLLGTGLGPTLAAERRKEAVRRSFAPVPIPGGTPSLGGYYHIFGPAPTGGDPIDAEPATITNFEGIVGLAYLSGMVTQTNTKTGEQQLLPFVDSDMRFMRGTFQGTDRQLHQAAFAFV
jgi:hypothetical protein